MCCCLRQAIPPELLKRLKANHAQIVKRVREKKFPPTKEGVSQGLRHSWESPKLGVVDAFRLYAMDEAYEVSVCVCVSHFSLSRAFDVHN